MSPSPETDEGRAAKRQKGALAVENFDGSHRSQTTPGGNMSQDAANGGGGGMARGALDGVESLNTVEIVPDGDVLIGVSGLAGVHKPISLRVSSHILALTSAKFKHLLATTATAADHPITLPLPAEDGDTMLLLCHILHLRNDKLPPRLPAESLYKLASMAHDFACAVAVGRATAGWFDALYHSGPAPSPPPPPPPSSTTAPAPAPATAPTIFIDPVKILLATLLLDEPTYFVRFTARWILAEPFASRFPVPPGSDAQLQRLSRELQRRRTALLCAARQDVDLLIEPCSVAFARGAEHYIDYAPGMSPDSGSFTHDNTKASSLCHVDSMAATLYLGALRDAGIWPATVSPASLGELVVAMRDFRVPEYDDCDKCDFCEGVKGLFGSGVGVVGRMWGERCWGLCLDCFNRGGDGDGAGGDGGGRGECRWEHGRGRV
ncbi:hypothetical protein LTR08_002954 [Meristemomyces frigidus]|nr:hypothetical protein LTR08_002954 [Meristemomyces frigidus]